MNPNAIQPSMQTSAQTSKQTPKQTPARCHPRVAQALWQRLWETYRQRVPYAQVYEEMIQSAGGQVANDHMAFRSLRLKVRGDRSADLPLGNISLGIAYLEPIVQWLGYEVAGDYFFEDTHLYARHYRHPEQATYDLPKLFISELIVEALPHWVTDALFHTVREGSEFFSLKVWPPYQRLQARARSLTPAKIQPEQFQPGEIEQLAQVFSRPWLPPQKSVVEAVNTVSQYGAWVMLYGYSVNHFTGYINRQMTPTYPDIASTAAGLKARGVPMKPTLEGSPASGLEQTATEAILEPVEVRCEGRACLGNHDPREEILWRYAYYELAQRHPLGAGENAPLFEGFIAPQAAQLFEMTRTGQGQ